ncbi:MAG: hypothetical protein IJ617_01625 [Oscillospiraceae bacterium]|nr:hypothetical protein [Oscillospiraceae bacterium]
MGKLRENILFWVLLIAGLCCCCFSLLRRFAVEARDRSAAFAISYQHVQLLARESGLETDEWLARLSGAGVHYLVANNMNFHEAQAAAAAHGMEIGRASATARPGDAFLLPPLDLDMYSRRPVRGFDLPQGDRSVPTALVENWKRSGLDTRAPFNELLQVWDGPMVKTMYMLVEYHQNYAAGDTPSNPENIIFTGIFERNIRLVVLTPMTPYAYNEGSVVGDPAEYEKMMASLAERLAERGLRVGDVFSCMEAPARSPALLFGCMMLPLAMGLLLLTRLLSLTGRWKNGLLLLGAAVAALGCFIPPDENIELLQKCVAFGTAVLAACWAALWLGMIASDRDSPWTRWKGPLPLRYLAALAGLLACALAGGLTVGALLADRTYLFGFAIFTGVKLSQILPIAFSGVLLLVILFLRNRREGWHRPPLALVFAMFLAAGAALVVIVLRSGDNMIPVAALELKLRDWLELKLFARPRTKEFLLAFPALALFVTACEKRVPILALPLGVLSEVGAVSVVNTFCHMFTPLRVSLIRTALGAALGAVIGLAGLAVFAWLLELGRKRDLKRRGKP